MIGIHTISGCDPAITKERVAMRIYFSILAISLCLSVTAQAADVISERKAGFRGNVAALKIIKAAIPAGDTPAIAAEARKVADWSSRMIDYFPEGSGEGDTKALPNIWTEFDDFTALAKNAENAAVELAMMADKDEMTSLGKGLGKLAGTCKACHQRFKE